MGCKISFVGASFNKYMQFIVKQAVLRKPYKSMNKFVSTSFCGKECNFEYVAFFHTNLSMNNSISK